MGYRIALLPGDGIGPEVTEATLDVLHSTGIEFEWVRHNEIGAVAMEKTGTPLPGSVLDSIRETKIALKAPITTPIGKGFRSVNVQLRQKLELFANVRPCQSLPGLDTPFKNVDIVIFRENTEGLYSGMETYDEKNEIADSIARVSRAGSEKIVTYAFEYARRHNRPHVTAVHKANILKLTSGMFLEIAQNLSRSYPDIEFDDRIIDNMCMQLVTRPQDYRNIVTTNLFGDILSDLCAGLVGGLGVVAGANIGEKYAVFEAVHGSAPDIAGKNIANPTALIRSAELMLRHLGEIEAADAIHDTLLEIYSEGSHLTADLGGTSGTREFGKYVAERVSSKIS